MREPKENRHRPAVDTLLRSALEHVDVDLCLPLSEIAPQLARLVRKEIPADEEGAYDVPDEMGNEMPKLDPRMPDNVAKLGHPSDFTCLECDGPL